MSRRNLVVLVAVTVGWPASATAATAAPGWLPAAQTIYPRAGLDASPTTTNAPAAVGMSARGETVALLTRYDGGITRLYASVRPPGGASATAQPVGTEGATSPALAVAGDGTAIAVWFTGSGAAAVVRYAVCPPGGSFSPPADVPGGDRAYGSPRVAFDGAGNATIAWTRVTADSTGAEVETVTRSASGTFAPRQTVSGTQAGTSMDLAVGSGGDAIVGWSDGYGVAAAQRAAGAASFGPAQPIGAAALGAATNLSVALGSDGSAGAAWWQNAGGADPLRVRAAVHRPGLAWGARATVSATDPNAAPIAPVDTAFDAAGAFTMVWSRATGSAYVLERATVPPGTSTPGPAVAFPGTGDVYRTALVADPLGNLLLAYDTQTPSAIQLRATARDAAGVWAAPTPIAPAGGTGDENAGAYPSVATDAAGNGVVLYGSSRNHGNPTDPPDAVLAAGYDGAGPLLDAVTVPAGGFAGDPLTFSVTPLDVWSPVTGVSWAFGDGSSAAGAAVTHAYATAGTPSAVVTATDDRGNATTSAPRTTTVTVRPPAAPDVTAPRLSLLSLSHTTFRVGAKATAVSARVRKRAPVGTSFRFTISERANVRVAIVRERPGRRVKGVCRATGRRTARRCTRLVAVGILHRKVLAGKVRIAFSGRVGAKRLVPGRYRAVIVASDAAKNTTRAKPLRFRVVR